jgi:tRNA-dihydrouridine synthase 2
MLSYNTAAAADVPAHAPAHAPASDRATGSDTKSFLEKLRGGMVLGPMVRVSTLPLRLLALEHGASAVWTEEMVAKKVATCQRVENPRLGTVEFYDPHSPWTRVWQTCAAETSSVVFQIGASTAGDAVAAANVVREHVSAFCLNMGCPKEFSVKNGMGAALLRKPATAADIIRALKSALALPVLAKIRLLESLDATVQLIKELEAAGVDAITVHLRHVDQRSSVPAHRALLRKLVEAVNVCVIGNGDVKDSMDAAGIHAYMHTYIHAYIHPYIHPSIHPSIHPYIYTCIHTYTHTYIHAYIHTYKHTFSNVPLLP